MKIYRNNGKYDIYARPLASPPPVYASNNTKSLDLRERKWERRERLILVRERRGCQMNTHLKSLEERMLRPARCAACHARVARAAPLASLHVEPLRAAPPAMAPRRWGRGGREEWGGRELGPNQSWGCRGVSGRRWLGSLSVTNN